MSGGTATPTTALAAVADQAHGLRRECIVHEAGEFPESYVLQAIREAEYTVIVCGGPQKERWMSRVTTKVPGAKFEVVSSPGDIKGGSVTFSTTLIAVDLVPNLVNEVAKVLIGHKPTLPRRVLVTTLPSNATCVAMCVAAFNRTVSMRVFHTNALPRCKLELQRRAHVLNDLAKGVIRKEKSRLPQASPNLYECIIDASRQTRASRPSSAKMRETIVDAMSVFGYRAATEHARIVVCSSDNNIVRHIRANIKSWNPHLLTDDANEFKEDASLRMLVATPHSYGTLQALQSATHFVCNIKHDGTYVQCVDQLGRELRASRDGGAVYAAQICLNEKDEENARDAMRGTAFARFFRGEELRCSDANDEWVTPLLADGVKMVEHSFIESVPAAPCAINVDLAVNELNRATSMAADAMEFARAPWIDVDKRDRCVVCVGKLRKSIRTCALSPETREVLQHSEPGDSDMLLRDDLLDRPVELCAQRFDTESGEWTAATRASVFTKPGEIVPHMRMKRRCARDAGVEEATAPPRKKSARFAETRHRDFHKDPEAYFARPDRAAGLSDEPDLLEVRADTVCARRCLPKVSCRFALDDGSVCECDLPAVALMLNEKYKHQVWTEIARHRDAWSARK